MVRQTTNTSIYSIDSSLVNEVRRATTENKSEFRVETDPSYIAFSRAVQLVARERLDREIESYKLIGLWSKAKNFSNNWNTSGPNTARRLAWTAFHFTKDMWDVRCIVLAWMNSQNRYPNDDQVTREVFEMTEQVWKDVQPSLRKQKDGKNKNKRKNRGKKAMARPRSVRVEIDDALRHNEAGASPDELAKILDRTVDSIQSCLRRMKNAGEVVRTSYGVYKRATTTTATIKVQPPASAVEQQQLRTPSLVAPVSAARPAKEKRDDGAAIME